MKQYVFLFGRPGCGKSAVYRRIQEHLKENKSLVETVRYDDYPILLDVVKNDSDNKRHIDGEDGGFIITDDGLWDDLLVKLNDYVVNHKGKNQLVFIEFARKNYTESLKNFSNDIIDNSTILYIQCPFDICWSRNVARVERQRAEGIDAHLTSREEMEKTYLNDDGLDLKNHYDNAVILDNSSTSLDELEKQIDDHINEIIKN